MFEIRAGRLLSFDTSTWTAVVILDVEAGQALEGIPVLSSVPAAHLVADSRVLVGVYDDGLTGGYVLVGVISSGSTPAAWVTTSDVVNGTLLAADLASSLYSGGNSWTPRLRGYNTVGSNTYNTGVTAGLWYRVGGLVFAFFQVFLTAKGAGGSAMGNDICVDDGGSGTLPTCANVGIIPEGVIGNAAGVTYGAGRTKLGCYMLPNDDRIVLTVEGSGMTAANVTEANVTGTTLLRGHICYPG